MKKWIDNKSTLFFASLLAIVYILLHLIVICNMKPKMEVTEEKMHLILESIYFEGQKDAISGDVRIAKEGEQWKWIKSPYDDTHRWPIYNPNDNSKTPWIKK